MTNPLDLPPILEPDDVFPASRAQDLAGTDTKNRPWLKPLIGIILLAIILFTGPVYGWLTSDGKIDPAIDRSAPTVDVEVIVPFQLEEYHRDSLSDLGVYSGRIRDPSVTGARLRAVSQEDLDRIARLFWVEYIRPAGG